LIALLEEGTVALSLLWDFSWDRITNDKLRVRKLFDDPMVLVVAHDHPLVDEDEVSMRALAQEEWILRADDHPVVEVMRRASSRAGFQPKVAFYANDYAEAQAMVSVGLGVALIPRTAMANQLDSARGRARRPAIGGSPARARRTRPRPAGPWTARSTAGRYSPRSPGSARSPASHLASPIRVELGQGVAPHVELLLVGAKPAEVALAHCGNGAVECEDSPLARHR
jgi:hypothetical protein